MNAKLGEAAEGRLILLCITMEPVVALCRTERADRIGYFIFLLTQMIQITSWESSRRNLMSKKCYDSKIETEK